MKEAEVAAKWWADCLRVPRAHNNGDMFQSALSNFVAKLKLPLTSEQIDKFESILKEKITERCAGWDRSAPNFGSIRRCIGVDYGADVILHEAAVEAGFDEDTRLPIKTNMWVNPGEVKVAAGYGAPIEIIWSEKEIESGK